MLTVESRGPVLLVRLNRPEVRNAFNDELIGALRDLFDGLDRGVRAVVLGGEGKSFCAGGDLNWMRKAAGYTEVENTADALRLAELYEAITTCRALVIAEVHGACFGGGCGLVAAADVAVAEEGTKFSFSEVRLGLVPATIGPFVMRKIGGGHARALFTTGEVFETEKALRIGLVHEVAPSGQLHEAAMGKVRNVLRNGPEAVAACKVLTQQGPVGLEESARLLARTRAGTEAREGLAAFLEKRTASFVEDLA